MAKHRYNLIRFDTGTAGTSYKLFVRSLYDYVIVKEVTTSDVTERSYFVAAKDLETSWTNRASLTYSIDIRGRKLVNEGQNWLAAAGRTFTGLLDTYGGAAVAYSFNLLSSQYSGNCLTVRRASDNATLDIGFSNNELDTTSLTAFCAGTDGFVTTWFDQSGNANNAVQTTASSQGKIVSSGSYLGYIDATNSSSRLFNLPFQYSSTQLFTSFIVGQSTGYGIYGGTDDNNIFYAAARPFNTDPSYNNFTNVSYYVNQNAIGLTRDNLYQATTAKSIITSFAQLSSSTSFAQLLSSTNNAAIGYISGANNFNVNAFIIYNSDESSNRSGIETALNDYYNIF